MSYKNGHQDEFSELLGLLLFLGIIAVLVEACVLVYRWLRAP